MSLDSLYPDVNKHIISFIDLDSLGRMCQVSKKIKNLIYDEKKDLRVEKYIESFILDQKKFGHWRGIMSDLEIILLECCKLGRPLVVIKYLINKGVNPIPINNRAIMSASENGHVDVVKLLLSYKRVDPWVEGSFIRVDPSVEGNYAIRWASRNGHLETVKALLSDPRVDPSAEDNYTIQWASRKGYVEIVKLLLSDPRVKAC
jgi:ankyrin repeat protein